MFQRCLQNHDKRAITTISTNIDVNGEELMSAFCGAETLVDS